jgi:hypothetical protein
MNTLIKSDLSATADCNPPAVYRVMSGIKDGIVVSLREAQNSAQSGGEIPTIQPRLPEGVTAGSATELGVRKVDVGIEDDNPDQTITPRWLEYADSGGEKFNRIGLSISPTLASLPKHRRPRRQGGTGSDQYCCFRLPRTVIEEHPRLRLHFDEGDSNMAIQHGVIEPGSEISLREYAECLSATQSQWVCLNW